MSSFLDKYMGKNAERLEAKTFKEERKEAEATAAKFVATQKESSSKYASMASPEKEAFNPYLDKNDRHPITQKASQFLKSELGKLIGKGGAQIDLEEFKVKAGRKDVTDESDITDEALLAFACKFTTPKAPRTARFIVAYNYNSPEKFVVANVFFDTDGNQFELTAKNLTSYLTSNSVEITDVKETPLVYFNPNSEFGFYDQITNLKEPVEKVAARLNTLGLKTTREYVDKCISPKGFGGRTCFVVRPNPADVENLLKVAALSDDEWFSRGVEKANNKQTPDDKWVNRATDGEAKAPEGDAWFNRSLESGKDSKKTSYPNPYKGESGIMVDSNKKEAKKEHSILDDLNDLDKILK